MSEIIVSAEELKHLKIFQGRILSLLGDISTQVKSTQEFLEYTFRDASYASKDDIRNKISRADSEDDYDDEDYGDGGNEE